MPDDNGNGNEGNLGEGSNNVVMQSVDTNSEAEEDSIININPVSGANNSNNVENIVIDGSENENRNIAVDPAAPDLQNVDLDLDVNIELVNQEVLGPQIDFDADAEEFRRRFYEAISRRNAQLVEDSPPAYDDDEEYDERDNINLIEEMEDQDDDSFDGVTTGQPSSREDRDFSDENPMEREEVSSVPVFDLQLPSRHAYLGEAMEALSGRQILEGGTVTDIPLVLLDFHLVPGQTLPLTVFHAVTQSALRRCVPNNRHFGIVHSGLNDVNIRSPLPRRALGTTAEIYEFQEEREPEPGSPVTPSINIKAKGRHRFNVLSTYRQSDGHLYAKVRIRPEISLVKQPWRNLMSNGHRYMFPDYPLAAEESPNTTTTAPPRNRRSSSSSSGERRVRQRKRSGNSSSSSQNISNKSNSENLDEVTESSPSQSQNASLPNSTATAATSSQESSSSSESRKKMTGLENNRKINRYYSAMSSWPYFVYEQFDESILVEKLHRKLTTELSSLTTATVPMPRDATDLSFWLAQNLTMNDSLRLQILKMDTPIERLRFASRLIDKVSRIIECHECQAKIANHNDIFSMSIEGPQGTYVNPHGYVHELITVSRITGALTRGRPSTESSWFPGYSWTILECRLCHEHIGWKFIAEERLKPSKFWGLARRSVSFKYDFSLENDCPDLDAPIAPKPD